MRYTTLLYFSALLSLPGVQGCQPATSAQCSSDDGCAFGRVCINGACVPGASCQDSLGCPGDQACVNGGCVLVTCTRPEDCDPLRSCRGGLCIGESDIGGDKKDATPQDIPCTWDTDCPSGLCNTLSGRCVITDAGPVIEVDAIPCEGEACEGRCRFDEDCNQDQFCRDDGYCVIGCRLSGVNCGAQELCNPETRACESNIGACAVDAECRDHQFCDSGRCQPGCRLSPDNCTFPQYCEGTSHVCSDVRCEIDEACAVGLYCAPDRRCVEGCRLDPDTCGAAATCDPNTHLCQCASDEGCAADEYCVAGLCREGCRLDPDNCGEGGVCAQSRRRCACLVDDFCPANTYCDADGACAPGCRVGSCPGEVCDLASRACVSVDAPCGGDADCAEEAYCTQQGRCALGCRRDNCPGSDICNLETRLCGCGADEGCEPGRYCSGGDCVPGCRLQPDDCGPQRACDLLTHRCECITDAGCPNDQYCAPDGSCQLGCRVGGDGCNGQACDPATHRCGCAADTDCLPAEFCDGGVCGEGCRAAPDNCERGACDPLTHLCACEENRDCPSERYCGPDLRCHVGCRDPNNCPAGGLCDLQTRVCGCIVDADCFQGDYCLNGVCAPGCRVSPDSCGLQRCDPITRVCGCQADEHCRFDEYCSGGVCLFGCRLEPDFCFESFCDPSTRACISPHCARDEDCGGGRGVCRVYTTEANQLALRCMAPTGEGRDDHCLRDQDCASRMCVGQDFCFNACFSANDCPSGRCDVVRISQAGIPAQDFMSCRPPRQHCLSDQDCEAGKGCTAVGEDALNPGFAELACIPMVPGSGLTGDACERDAACFTGICIAPGICWGPCDVVNQTCPEGTRCYPNALFLNLNGAQAGVPGCEPDRGSGQLCPDGRCPAGEACALRPNQNYTGFDGLCFQSQGAGIGNSPCAGPADCASGVCMEGGRCFGLCDPADPAGQCAGGSGCVPVDVAVWDNGTVADPSDDVMTQIHLCAP
ncbi:hypothetical protein KKB55_19845 [Myxococcota bacterium]|nr:hypothetical protein [Myxococcota bacterium]MBU1900002.1 hypothetical protein [Myxococcota bacterium]